MDDTPITVGIFAKKYDWPTESALRAYIFFKKENGLEKAFLKIGRRVLIKPKTFFQLIESYHEKTKT